ncbi:hypothetical protein BU23DRAFT_601012 [Bimuria novae-zelandiae CBS 107.79]|uniref:SET domain-containing protein n=1 Tax=Bimuria novae-zelandiae CBS 107.79 TaxID=1447943 RepID=A0A6A5UZ52_9PLEO|nr:hypothetical protein BU23DRAFT_601012 [Bimuria novae-zelandiae CBS 107.79]
MWHVHGTEPRAVRQEYGGGWAHLHTRLGKDVKQILCAWNGNAVTRGYLGVKCAMLNHSCAANAFVSFEDSVGRLVVHALKDIEEGEEICRSYLEGKEMFGIAEEQRKVLEVQRGFKCLCETCVAVDEHASNEPDALHPDDEIRAEMRELMARYTKAVVELSKGWCHVHARAAVVELIQKLGLMSIDYLDWPRKIARWNLALGKKDAAMKWMVKILAIIKLCLGEESQMYRDGQAQIDGEDGNYEPDEGSDEEGDEVGEEMDEEDDKL